MLLKILLDGFPGFADVNGEKNQPFIGEFMADFVDEAGFVGAEGAPGGPEFEENDFAFDGIVSKFFTSGGGGVKAGRGMPVRGAMGGM